ncbi:conjugative transposon protein TraM [Hymenobacter sp. BT507]|uniref:Conjugative transposon protein TraM n=1 Tax=Hymenobacter citatus TaxID=2763506 RepID=A0ABR7MMY4_9BACT|nr:conjugative transposon protein TraM [Hymenobacter citatus]MBC6612439.1 conjugative transposon protein TraM [Hymenobacter citatus]
MNTVYEGDGAELPVAESTPVMGEPRQPVTALKKKSVSLGQLARTYWWALILLILMCLIGGLVLYARMLVREDQASKDPIAGSSANIAQVVPKPATEEVAPPSASEVMAHREDIERREASTEVKPTADQLAHTAFPVDTVGRAAQQRAQRQQMIATTSPSEPVLLPPASPAKPTPAAVVKTRRSSAPAPAQLSAGKARGVRAARVSPAAVAPDGVPYETNEDVNQMLAAAPEASRKVYEQMTGRRYREPAVVNRAAGTAALNALPGMDGFYTIRQGSAGTGSGELVPEVFYKCLVNGAQKVRSGSVVLLRLAEDAVVSGVTFPKNTVFAGIVSVNSNQVTITVNRLAAYRVEAKIFDYNYLPGIMIDPSKKAPVNPNTGIQLSAQQAGFNELGAAIDRSQSAANSTAGIAARVGTSIIQRLPRSGSRLRDVLLPDGYPILITTATAGQVSNTETGSSNAGGAPLPFLNNDK